MRVLFLILLLASFAEAQTAITRYVNTDCANNGDGTASTCAAGVGLTGAYTTMANGATDVATDYPNMVTSDVVVTLDCRGTAEDTSAPLFNSITTDATRYLIVGAYGSNAHSGSWSTSKYRIGNSDTTAVVRTRLTNIRFENLQIDSKASTGGNKGIRFETGSGGGNIRITGNIIRGSGTTTDAGNMGIDWDGTALSSTNMIIANNIIYDFANDGMRIYGNNANDKFVIYNNTVADCGAVCIDLFGYGATDTARIRNNLMQNCTGNDYALTSSFTNYSTQTNVTEDATSPDGASFQSKVATFTNEASDDFTLSGSDTVAKDLGTNLSADGDFAFSTDLIGTTRPQGSAWDIGASETTGGGGGSSVTAVLTANGEI